MNWQTDPWTARQREALRSLVRKHPDYKAWCRRKRYHSGTLLRIQIIEAIHDLHLVLQAEKLFAQNAFTPTKPVQNRGYPPDDHLTVDQIRAEEAGYDEAIRAGIIS